MLRSTFRTWQDYGVSGLAHAIRNRINPDRLAGFEGFRSAFESRNGIEIGGPSAIFSARGCAPVYPIAGRIDNCNFGPQTVWEGRIRTGETFVFDPSKPHGRQYLAEATDLAFAGDGTYDFVLSSHCIEHLANPLKGLYEWRRVLKEGGYLVLVVPHREGTFDHRRPVTRLEHLIDDHRSGMQETDLTHLDEILELHDLRRDREAGGAEAFRERSLLNAENRCLHHHVFDTSLVTEILDHVGLQIRAIQAFRPYHIVAVTQKLREGEAFHNEPYLVAAAQGRLRSPFRTDKRSGDATDSRLSAGRVK